MSHSWQIIFFAVILILSSFVHASAAPDYYSGSISGKVLFMKINSTGKIVVRWETHYPRSNGTYNVTKEIYRAYSQNPFPLNSPDLTIISNPASINLNADSTIVTYAIAA